MMLALDNILIAHLISVRVHFKVESLLHSLPVPAKAGHIAVKSEDLGLQLKEFGCI